MTATQDPPESKGTNDQGTAGGKPARRNKRQQSPVERVLNVLGSLKLTVIVLLALGVLTWLGTLAQMHLSLHDVQRDYFESWFIVHDTHLPEGAETTLRVPLPGGALLIGILFLNLLIGGVIRMKWRWKSCGVLIGHLGILLLLIKG